LDESTSLIVDYDTATSWLSNNINLTISTYNNFNLLEKLF
jgi:hypothetical protein